MKVSSKRLMCNSPANIQPVPLDRRRGHYSTRAGNARGVDFSREPARRLACGDGE